MRTHTEFHATIARASGNQRLARVLIQLLYEAERIFHVGTLLLAPDRPEPHEHREPVDALRAGDAEAAARISHEQILRGQKALLDGLLSRPELISLSLVSQERV